MDDGRERDVEMVLQCRGDGMVEYGGKDDGRGAQIRCGLMASNLRVWRAGQLGCLQDESNIPL